MTEQSRRRFIQIAVVGAAAPLVGIPMAHSQATKVSEDDAISKSLAYVHDASQSTHAAHVAGRICSNCALYVTAQAVTENGEEWAPCGIFRGNLVKGAGWCSAWVPKA